MTLVTYCGIFRVEAINMEAVMFIQHGGTRLPDYKVSLRTPQ